MSYKDFINYKENEFQVRVFNNQQRVDFIRNYQSSRAKEMCKHYASALSKLWFEVFNKPITNAIIEEYLKELTANPNDDVLHYSKENITRITREFILRKAKEE